MMSRKMEKQEPMKKIFPRWIWIKGTCLVIFIFAAGCSKKQRDAQLHSPFQNGDVIFQSLKSNQSDAIQLATNSKYSHCGIIFWEGDNCYVYEAFRKVKSTPVDKFLERSKGGHYAVRRLKNAGEIFSTPEKVNVFVQTYYNQFSGKPYDIRYEASDEKIYCSELVWKLYKASANIDVAAWKKLGEFDLSNKIVQEELHYTYGDKVPLEEPIVSPEALYASDQFTTVLEK